MTGLQPAGLPHSEIAGSIVICTSPALIAAYHVLLRLREPRHPPSALAYFLFPCTYTPLGMCRIDISLKLALFLLLYCFVVHHVKDLLFNDLLSLKGLKIIDFLSYFCGE